MVTVGWIIRALFGSRRAFQVTRLHRRSRPSLEALEDRCVPATLTVTDPTDVVDGSDDPLSLREALLAALPGDSIKFDPTITNISLVASLGVAFVTIDGGEDVNGIPLVSLDFTSSTDFAGLWLTGGGATIENLTILNVTGAGIEIDSDGNTIQSCVISQTAADATNQVGHGVLVSGSDNTISGCQIEDSDGAGIFIGKRILEGSPIPTGNQVLRNRLLNNGESGLALVDTDDTMIRGNVIAGNGQGGQGNLAGIGIVGNNNTIQDNFIGVLDDGATVLGNAGSGIDVSGMNNIIRKNVISGNGMDGVQILHAEAVGNVVQRNLIGTNQDGTLALPNALAGVALTDNASGNLIGGISNPDDIQAGNLDNLEGNLISGNTGEGVVITTGASGNFIEGNAIGTDLAGVKGIPNGGQAGVAIIDTPGNIIGGAEAGQGNLVSGNLGVGVAIIGADATGNGIERNGIGVNIQGQPLPNALGGVFVGDEAGLGSPSRNGIGGTTAGFGNVIAFNHGNGVTIESGAGNAILGNSIFANTGLGIDLGNDGVTLNDAGDADRGANSLQNFPTLFVLTNANGSKTLLGQLSSTPSSAYRIEVFANAAKDPTGFGEGQTFLGAANISTDSSGLVLFNFALPAGATFVTATATDITNLSSAVQGNTSEFSAIAAPISLPAASAVLAVNNTITQTDDITLFNPPSSANPFTQTLPVKITNSAATSLPLVLSVSPPSAATLSRTSLILAPHATITVTLTPRAVSRAVNDVHIVAKVWGLTKVAYESLTIVSVLAPAIRNADTPKGMADRLPPRVLTNLPVTVTPNLGLSGQSVTLTLTGQSASNGTATFNHAATLKLTASKAVSLLGGAQTAPGFAAKLHLAVLVRGAVTAPSKGFSVSAIPVAFHQTAVKTLPNGGLQFQYAWKSDSGMLADLNKVWIGQYLTFSDGGIHKGADRPWLADDIAPKILPSRTRLLATTGTLTDTLTAPGNILPMAGPADSYTATQHLGFHDLRADSRPADNTLAWQFDLAPALGIVRFVENLGTDAAPRWQYRITKNGSTSTVRLT